MLPSGPTHTSQSRNLFSTVMVLTSIRVISVHPGEKKGLAMITFFFQ